MLFNKARFYYYFTVIFIVIIALLLKVQLKDIYLVTFVILVLVGGLIVEYGIKRKENCRQSGLLSVLLPLVVIAIGFILGFNCRFIQFDLYLYGLLYSVGWFVVVSIPEYLFVLRMDRKYIRKYYSLDGVVFPFFSLGLAIGVFLTT